MFHMTPRPTPPHRDGQSTIELSIYHRIWFYLSGAGKALLNGAIRLQHKEMAPHARNKYLCSRKRKCCYFINMLRTLRQHDYAVDAKRHPCALGQAGLKSG